MKEITYQIGSEAKKITLTDSEFVEAMKCWNKNNSYYCTRLESSLSKFYKFAQTPPNELGYEVFFKTVDNGGLIKIFKKDKKYYKEIISNKGAQKIEVEIKDKTVLLPQEKSFGKNGLLIAGK